MERVVVVGGGVIGLCVADALRRRGLPVTVVDAGPASRAASHGNAGWIVPSLSGPVPAPGLVRTSLRWMLRPGSPLRVRPRVDPGFLRWLLAFCRRCNARDHRAGLEATAALNARTMALFDALRADGVAFEEHRDGLAFVYRSRRALAHDYAGLEPLRRFGYETPPLLDGDALRAVEPALADGVVGGYRFAQERHVRPDSLVAGLERRLREGGADLRSGTAVTGVAHRRGVVSAVETTGGRIGAAAVVVCAGARTPAVMALAGVRVPIEAGKGYGLDYAPPPALPAPLASPLYLHEARVAVSPFAGTIRLAGTMELAGLDDRIAPARVAAIARAGARYLRGWPVDPGLATVRTGARPMTPDGLPVIGLAPGFDNLVVASGHAMLGVTLAPATGEAVAELLATGRTPDVIRPFDPGRFGSHPSRFPAAVRTARSTGGRRDGPKGGTVNVADLAGEIHAAWGGLADSSAFRVAALRPSDAAAEHRADEPMEVGSSFKAFVVAECCRRVERGTLRWDESLTLSSGVRVPDSTAFGDLPNGATVTAREAAEAMIAVSDNTATDLLLDRLGTDAVRSLVAEAGLVATRLPESVRAVYDAGQANPDGRAEACVSTMRDLTRFYACALGGDLFSEPSTLDAFKEILRQEDLDDGTSWPAGVRCYRKGGYLAPPPLLGTGIAGAFEANGRLVPFAFACNVALADDVAADGIRDVFGRGVGRGMRAVADALAG